jgi:hypothetical protein
MVHQNKHNFVFEQDRPIPGEVTDQPDEELLWRL